MKKMKKEVNKLTNMKHNTIFDTKNQEEQQSTNFPGRYQNQWGKNHKQEKKNAKNKNKIRRRKKNEWDKKLSKWKTKRKIKF